MGLALGLSEVVKGGRRPAVGTQSSWCTSKVAFLGF